MEQLVAHGKQQFIIIALTPVRHLVHGNNERGITQDVKIFPFDVPNGFCDTKRHYRSFGIKYLGIVEYRIDRNPCILRAGLITKMNFYDSSGKLNIYLVLDKIISFFEIAGYLINLIKRSLQCFKSRFVFLKTIHKIQMLFNLRLLIGIFF